MTEFPDEEPKYPRGGQSTDGETYAAARAVVAASNVKVVIPPAEPRPVPLRRYATAWMHFRANRMQPWQHRWVELFVDGDVRVRCEHRASGTWWFANHYLRYSDGDDAIEDMVMPCTQCGRLVNFQRYFCGIGFVCRGGCELRVLDWLVRKGGTDAIVIRIVGTDADAQP
jgi:hypothetical protein